MIRALNEMPPWGTFVTVVLLCNAIALGALFLSRWLMPRLQFTGHDPIVASTFDRISTFNALVLALVVVTLWSNFRSVQSDVNNEAAEMAHLGQDMLGFPPPDRKYYLAALRQYVHSVVYVEWNKLCASGGDAATDRQFNNLQQSIIVRKIPQNDGALRGDVMNRLAKLDQLRRMRLTSAGPIIINDVWVVLLLMSALILISPYFYNPGSLRLQLMMAVLLASALGTIFFLAVRLDYTLCGSTAVSPAAIIDVDNELAH